MEERELNELRYLKKEIRYQMERVRRLEEKATSVTQIIGGIPACKGITDRVAEYAPQIASMKTLIQNNIRWCLHLQYKIEAFIESIEESEMRQIFGGKDLEADRLCHDRRRGREHAIQTAQGISAAKTEGGKESRLRQGYRR